VNCGRVGIEVANDGVGPRRNLHFRRNNGEGNDRWCYSDSDDYDVDDYGGGVLRSRNHDFFDGRCGLGRGRRVSTV